MPSGGVNGAAPLPCRAGHPHPTLTSPANGATSKPRPTEAARWGSTGVGSAVVQGLFIANMVEVTGNTLG